MDESIVSSLLELLTSTISLETGVGLGRSSSIDNEVGKLADNFRAIQAVLKDAEEKQVHDRVVRLWLDELKDTSYDIEDALNEWKPAIRELAMKEANGDASKFLKKVSSLKPSLCFCSRQAHIATRIKDRQLFDLSNRLDVIAKEIEYFNFSRTVATREPITPRTTGFDISLSEVHGRDLEKKKLLDFLLRGISQESTLSIISIVGMGGIGKTTLAQLAYNDDTVSTRFDAKIWVRVTNQFNEIKIAEAILESLDGGQDLVQVVNVLQRMHQSISGNRFLIVLDDVWIEDPKTWEGLKNSLTSGLQGSRILVTTRKESTAEALGSNSMIFLGRLLDEECWAIFREITREEREKFEDIGKKIASKCRGSPFVVKTLGGHLRSRRNIAEWENFLSSELWELKEVERDIFPSLLLSYYDFPYPLKKCFLYCAIFPKDYYITKDELIKLWMAQGYLAGFEEEDMQVVGENYLELLAKHSLFQDVERTEYNRIIRCKMGDIMHGLTKILTRNECATVEFDDLANSQVDCYKGARHLMIIGNSIPSAVYGWRSLFSIYKEKKLRSLVFDSKFGHEVDLSKLFNNLTCMRTLSLIGCSTKNILGQPASKKFQEIIKKSIHLRYLNLSRNTKIEGLLEALWELYNLWLLDLSYCSIRKIQGGIKKLMHLRFLNLSHNEIEELPETLCELYNLQILDVTNCYRLKKLPQGIGKLTNLKRLRNHGTSLSHMPRGIQSLTCLQQLSKFAVSNVTNDQKASTLECLANFKHLGGFLRITGLGNIRDLTEVNQGKLKDKENILGLGLRFDGWMSDEDKGKFESIIPPPNLDKLMIEYYIGKTMPLDWIVGLTKLRVLELSSCFEFEELPPIGKLPSIESLYIWKMTSVKMVGKEFLRDEISSSSSPVVAFPKLKYLEIRNMEEWEEWYYDSNKDEDIIFMPALLSLKIYSCPKLKAVPDHIFQLKTLKLDISFCQYMEFSKDFKPSPNSEVLTIRSYMGKSISVSWIKSLANLKVLKILSCSELEDLPALGQLLSLESLSIGNMARVKKVDNKFLGDKEDETSSLDGIFSAFSKLQYLSFWNMEEWEEWGYDINKDEDIIVMPALLSLKLYSCPNLKAVPDHIFQSKMLKVDIDSCPYMKISEDFKPSPNSEVFTIQFYIGKSIPIGWIKSLAKLKVLKLLSCSELEDLPALGLLLSLESLSIGNMARVRKVGNQFLGEKENETSSLDGLFTAFPKLKYLAIWNMEELEEWGYDINEDEGITVMPALLSLKLYSCPKLKTMPNHIFQSKTLKLGIDSFLYMKIAEDFKPSLNLEVLTIQYYIEKSIPLSWIMSFVNLKVLKLLCSSELEYLPALGQLFSLESLSIWNMARVKTVYNEFLGETNQGIWSTSSSIIFPKLKYLTIGNMEEWDFWGYEEPLSLSITIMPALHSLKLHSCPKLRCLPSYVSDERKLQNVKITGCPSLDEWLKGKEKQKQENISNINNSHIPGPRDKEKIEDN